MKIITFALCFEEAQHFAQIPCRITTTKRKNEQTTQTYLEYAPRVRLLHNVWGLVVSLTGIWQERTLFISMS